MNRADARRVERVAMRTPALARLRCLSLLDTAANLAADARYHLARRLFGERHGDNIRDAPRRVLFKQHQESLDQHARLARPRARRDNHAPPARLYRFTLCVSPLHTTPSTASDRAARRRG